MRIHVCSLRFIGHVLRICRLTSRETGYANTSCARRVKWESIGCLLWITEPRTVAFGLGHVASASHALAMYKARL